MEKKFKIRFNLSKGKNFMKWKVTFPSGAVRYYDPEKVTLVMLGCYLRNQESTAYKIFCGAHKSVCAWIEAEHLSISKVPGDGISGTPVSYNPKIQPNWLVGGEISDGVTLNSMISNHRKLFTV